MDNLSASRGGLVTFRQYATPFPIGPDAFILNVLTVACAKILEGGCVGMPRNWKRFGLLLLAVTVTWSVPGSAQKKKEGKAAPGMTSPATTGKPNILFIMGDDIGWMQVGLYQRGLGLAETPNIDRIGREGAMFTIYYAEQSCTAGRNAFFTGMTPLRTGMIPPQLPGSPSYLQPGTPALAKFLYDLGYTTGEFGKNHLGDHTDALPTAHGFQEFWGYLYHLDAMEQVSFPDINASPTKQGVAPPCKNTPIPGLAEVPGAVDPKTTTV